MSTPVSILSMIIVFNHNISSLDSKLNISSLVIALAVGNIFYAIIAGEMPFEGQKESKAQKKVMDGTRPTIPDEVLESKDIAIKTLVSATRKCWEQKPEDRPSAASVRDEFKRVLDRIRKNNATKDS